MGAYAGPDIVESGLVLALDAGNSKSYPGSGTAWTDLSGRGNTGTLTNMEVPGDYTSTNGGILTFDGVNEHVDCGSSLLLSRPFTINSWVYFNSLTGWQTFVGQNRTLTGTNAAVYFQKVNSSGDVQGRTHNTFGIEINGSTRCYDATAVQTGVWYNYCVSVSTSQLLLYRNGNLVTTLNNGSALAQTTGSLYVGCGVFANALADYVNGRISNTTIYNRALSTTEIAQNYNALKSRYI